MKVKQNNLINSLKIQPLIIVIRLENDFFNITYKRDKLFFNIENLSNNDIKHIEIGWDPNPEWGNLISEIKNSFEFINIGAASISSNIALDSILQLDLNYMMSPFFRKELHHKAIEYNQLLIPGISNIEHLKEAINLDGNMNTAYMNLFRLYESCNLLEKLEKSLLEYSQVTLIKNELLLFKSRLFFRKKQIKDAKKLISKIEDSWVQKQKPIFKVLYWNYRALIEDKAKNYDPRPNPLMMNIFQ